MPAINPLQLRRDVERLVAKLPDVQAFQQDVVSYFEIHATRTRRPLISRTSPDEEHAFGVARSIVRALSRATYQRTVSNAELALEVASALWQTGYREARKISADLLSGLENRTIIAWIESFIPDCEDPLAIQEIADVGFDMWRSSDPEGFIQQIASWLDSEQPTYQLIGYYALASAVENGFTNLPIIFKLLQGRVQTLQGSVRNAMYLVVKGLARKSPGESARFLVDALERDGLGAYRLAKAMVDYLPIQQRAVVEQALSVDRRTGIMPLGMD